MLISGRSLIATVEKRGIIMSGSCNKHMSSAEVEDGVTQVKFECCSTGFPNWHQSSGSAECHLPSSLYQVPENWR
jgi:hypothetical protein